MKNALLDRFNARVVNEPKNFGINEGQDVVVLCVNNTNNSFIIIFGDRSYKVLVRQRVDAHNVRRIRKELQRIEQIADIFELLPRPDKREGSTPE